MFLDLFFGSPAEGAGLSRWMNKRCWLTTMCSSALSTRNCLSCLQLKMGKLGIWNGRIGNVNYDILELSVLLECRAKRVRITINNKMIAAEFQAWIGNEMGIWNVNWRIGNVNWDILELSVLLERRAKRVRITSNNKMIVADFQAWISASDDIVCLRKKIWNSYFEASNPLNLLSFSFCPFVCWHKRLSTRLLLDLNQWILWNNLIKRCWEQKRLKIKKTALQVAKNFDLYGFIPIYQHSIWIAKFCCSFVEQWTFPAVRNTEDPCAE